MAATQLFFDFSEPAPAQPEARSIAKGKSKHGKETLPDDFPSFEPYGSWVNYNKRLSSSEHARKNKEAIALLSKQKGQLSPDELTALRSYSGWGGLSESNERGALYDYYTSPPIAALAWKLLDNIQPIEKGASILEPSCGTGIFIAAGPKGAAYTGVELDKRSAAIASHLHPQADIIPQSYEAFNISSNSAERFDHAIGNIPFGWRTLETAFMDMPEEKSLDRYFISRSIDNLKPCGTMALIAHPGILANKSNIGWRLSINRKAQFMGAVKLNDHSFHHSHTSIQPDILF